MVKTAYYIENVIDLNGQSPFPGLRPFKTDESHLYFGREGQSHEIIELLGKNKFVALLGSSGTGKSSLVFSGVIPNMRAGIYDFNGKEWQILSFSPGLEPLQHLSESAAELMEQIKPNEFYPDYFYPSFVLSLLESSASGLDDLYHATCKKEGSNLLIYIDQFEELFRNKSAQNTGQRDQLLRLIDLVLEAVSTSKLPIYTIISMRSDFLGECEFFPEFTSLINNSHYLIPQMTREQRRLIIEGPISVMGANISNRLTQSLLNSISDKPDQLPVLQHALKRTWHHWSEYEKSNKPIDFVHYDAIGRLDKALSNHANECYDQLTDGEKNSCGKIFKAITERRSETDGIRRPRTVREIANIINVEEDEIITVVQYFRSENTELLLPRADQDLSSQSTVDIPHEALIRVWDKLNIWVQEEYESSQMFRQINEAAEKYDLGKGGLWRPPELTLALQWKRTEKPTVQWAAQYGGSFEKAINFLDISEKSYNQEVLRLELAQKRRVTRIRNIAFFMTLASFVSLGFYFYAIGQKSIADKQKERAELKAKEAAQKSRIARIEQENSERERKKATDATRSARREKRNAEQNLELAISAQREAEEQTLIAEQKTVEARAARDSAVYQKVLANEAKERAELSESQAKSLRTLSVARSMALKSQRLAEKELAGLLSSHAFVFFEENDGYQYDNDIYNGLLHSLELLNPDEFIASKNYVNEVRTFQFMPDGKGIFAAGTDGKVAFWDVTKERDIPKTIFSVDDAVIENIAVNSSGTQLIAVGTFNKVLSYDIASRQLSEIPLPFGSSYDAQFIQGTDDFLISSSDNALYLYKGASDELEKIMEFNSRVFDFQLVEGTDKAVVGTENSEVLVVDYQKKAKVSSIYKHQGSVIQAIVVIPNQNLVAVGDQKGQLLALKLDDAYQVTEELFLKGHENTIVSDLKFNQNTNQLISSSTDGSVRIWDLSAIDNFPIEIDNQDVWVMSIVTTPDGKYLYTGCEDRVLRKYPMHTPLLAEEVRSRLGRDMTPEEWERYVGGDISFKQLPNSIGMRKNK